jgi:hypothetical protein
VRRLDGQRRRPLRHSIRRQRLLLGTGHQDEQQRHDARHHDVPGLELFGGERLGSLLLFIGYQFTEQVCIWNQSDPSMKVCTSQYTDKSGAVSKD